jgi:hypothetical protein
MFRAGVPHENERTRFEIEVMDGMCMLVLKLLHRHEATLEYVGVDDG